MNDWKRVGVLVSSFVCVCVCCDVIRGYRNEVGDSSLRFCALIDRPSDRAQTLSQWQRTGQTNNNSECRSCWWVG